MHQQIRSVPAMSPPNLQAFLAVLKAAGINIEAAGGSDVERGGEFAVAVAHGQHDAAIAALQQAGYKPRTVDVEYCALENKAGQLLACVEKVAAKNAQAGRVIKDLAVGVPDAQGRVQVQIYSE